MQKLLLDSYPLVIIPELATALGLNESIVLQQIHYWTEINRKTDHNFRDGYYWTYNSYEGWQEQLPFWSVATIKRTLTVLKNQDLIIIDNYNKHRFDRTLWYRINYDVLSVLVSGIGEVKLTTCIGSNCTNAQPRGFAGDIPQNMRSLHGVADDPENVFEQEKFKRGERGNFDDPEVDNA